MNRTSSKSRIKFLFNTRLMLLIDLSQNLLFVLFFLPLFNQLLEYAIRFTDLSYITSENVLTFLTSWPAVILVLFLLIFVSMFLIAKLTSLIYYCNYAGKQKRLFLLRIASYGVLRSFRCFTNGNFGLLLYALPFYLLTNLPILIGVTIHADFGHQSGSSLEGIIKSIIILLFIVLSALSMHGIFAFHIGTLGELRFKEAYSLSKKLLFRNLGKTVSLYYRINLLLTLGYLLAYYLLLFLIALAVCLFTNKMQAVTIFLSVYPKINLFSIALYSVFSFIININLITTLYYSYQDENLRKLLPGKMVFPLRVTAFKRRHKNLINALLGILISVTLINFYFVIHNDSMYLSEALTGMQISSHRGNSHIAPENTIPALENAIAAYSDYAEIDVQQTEDGVLVLLHDRSLFRTAGVNETIWNMTYEEIKELDVGSWFGSEYSQTTIPTLEEVMEHCKGRIKLNIEIKANEYNYDLENRLVFFIEEYDFINQCVVSSSDYSSLIKIKELNEEIRTGYILSGVYGNFYEKEHVDFFSIRSNFLTKNVIDRIHKAGKEVHAWTVNSRKDLERMKTLDVDCVITDNPTLAREVLFRDDTNDSFLQLIKRMLTYRSLYGVFIN